MATVNDLLNRSVQPDSNRGIPRANYSGRTTNAALTPEFKQSLYSVAAGMGNQLGAATMGEIETDLRTKTPAELYLKYGPETAQKLIRAFNGQIENYQNDLSNDYDSATEVAQDFGTSAAQAVIGTFGGLASLGTSLVNDQAGAAIANAVQGVNQSLGTLKTEEAKQSNRALGAQARLESRDVIAQYQADIEANPDSLVPYLQRVGEEALNAGARALSNEAALTQLLGNATGSFALGGALTKGVTALGGKFASGFAAAGINIPEKALKLGRQFAFPAAISGQEGVGSYLQTTNQVLDTSIDELRKTSPQFNQLVDELQEKEDLSLQQAEQLARNELAVETGLDAAGITAAVALPISMLSRAAELPVARSLTRIAKDVPSEALEEGLQGVTGQLASNVALQQNVNPEQDIIEGVGRQLGTGVVGGAGTVGIIQSPRIATLGSIAGVKATGKGLKKGISALMTRGDKLLSKDEEKNSPISRKKVTKHSKAATENLADDVADMQQAVSETSESIKASDELTEQARNQINNMAEALNLTMPSGESIPRIQAIFNITDRLKSDTELTADQRIQGLATIEALLEPIYVADEASDNTVLESIDSKSEAGKTLNQYKELLTAIPQVQEIAEAQVKIINDIKSGNISLPEISDEEFSESPELAQAKSEQLAAVAALAPEELNENQVETVLHHAKSNKLNLSSVQQAALKQAGAILRGSRIQQEFAAKSPNITESTGLVNSQVTVGPQGVKLSAKSFAKNIYESVKRGETSTAEQQLDAFRKFVVHMTNKVEALNDNFKTDDNKTPFMALDPSTGEFVSSTSLNKGRITEGMFVNKSSPKSIAQAQLISAERNTIAAVYNSLTEAFPQLDQQAVKDTVDINEALWGDPDEVVKQLKQPAQSQEQIETTTTPEAPVEPVTATQEAEQSVDTNEVETSSEEPTEAAVEDNIPVVAEPTEQEPEAQVEEQSDIDTALITALQEDLQEETTQENTEEDVEPTSQERVAGALSVNESTVEAYPGLIAPEANRFYSAYSIRTKAKTKILNAIDILSSISSLVSSGETSDLEEALGEKQTNKLLDESVTNTPVLDLYSIMLSGEDSIATKMKNLMNENLQDFYKKVKDPAVAITYKNGKQLNIAEPFDDTVKFNDELLDRAVLAALQWTLTANTRQSAITAKRASQITGIPEEAITSDVINQLNIGLDLGTFKTSLSNKIKEYWDVQDNPEEMIGLTDGITEAIAVEAVNALEKLDLVEVTVTKLGKENGLLQDITIKNVETKVSTGKNTKPFSTYPTLIDDLVLKNPEPLDYFGKNIPPLERTQLNSTVPITKKQRRANNTMQKQAYYFDMPMINLYRALGKDFLRAAFGGGSQVERERNNTDSPDNYLNVNYAATLRGQNITVIGAFDNLEDQLTRAEFELGIDGSIEDLAVHYPFDVISTGRHYMRGAYTPQTNTLLREAILPTWATLNLESNEEHINAFYLSIAQSLGRSIENYTLDNNVDWAKQKLQELEPSINALSAFASEKSDKVGSKTLLDNLNNIEEVDISERAVHALLEYARFLSQENKSEFRTSLYVEADGKTNGVLNAVMLLNTGEYTETQLESAAKGGVVYGSTTSMDQLSDRDQVDIYKTASAFAKSISSSVIQAIKKAPLETNKKTKKSYIAPSKYTDSFTNVLETLLPGDVTYNPKEGSITLSRGISKNPVTIFIYGSSTRGIAGKLSKELTDSFYQRLSAYQSALPAGQTQAFEALLDVEPNTYDSNELNNKVSEFVNNFNILSKGFVAVDYITGDITTNRGRYPVFGDTQNDFKTQMDFTKYTLNYNQTQNIISNMQLMLAEPIEQGIIKTIGSKLDTRINIIKDVTNFHSAIYATGYRHLLRKAIQENNAKALEQAKAEGLTGKEAERRAKQLYNTSLFLTKKQLDSIKKTLTFITPQVSSNNQNFFISKEAKIPGIELVEAYGNSKLRTESRLYAPIAAGVAGIPYLVQGFGDAQAVMNMYSEKNMNKTVQIFDGIHTALDNISTQGLGINEAVQDTWSMNPYQLMQESFQGVFDNESLVTEMFNDELDALSKGNLTSLSTQAPLTDLLLRNLISNTQERNEIISKILKGEGKSIKIEDELLYTVLLGELNHSIKNYTNVLSNLSSERDNQLVAESTTARSSDQLAGLYSPATQNQTEDTVTQSIEQTVKELNDKVNEAKNINVELRPTFRSVLKFGKEQVNGTTILTPEHLKQLHKIPEFSQEQKDVIKTLTDKPELENYTVIIGSRKELGEYPDSHINRGEGIVFGSTNPGTKTVYLVDDGVTELNPETFVHEIVHAATYNTIAAYYQGRNKISAAVQQSVKALEASMEDFMDTEASYTNYGFNALEDIRQAQLAIHNQLDQGNKAAALNEFMAWTLANKKITEQFKERNVPEAVKAVLKYYNQVKDLIIKALGLHANANLFNNILFNTEVVASSSIPGFQETNELNTLQHAVYPNSNPRLNKLRKTFSTAFLNYVDEYKDNNPYLHTKRTIEAKEAERMAQELTDKVVGSFHMNIEEASIYRLMVQTFATQAKIDPNVLGRVQEIYEHVAPQLYPDDFMDHDDVNQQQQEYDGQHKLNAVLGGMDQIGYDKYNRSTLLSSFLALSMVSDQLREVLAKTDLPTSEVNQGTSLDAILDRSSKLTMDKLSTYLSGENSAKDATEALDNLVEQIDKTLIDEKSYLSSVGNQINSLRDTTDKIVSDYMSQLGNKASEYGQRLVDNSNNRITKSAGHFLHLTTGLLDQDRAAAAADGVIGALNKTDKLAVIRRFVHDVVGRTENNAGVYDLIKNVHATVHRARQQYKEKTPKILRKKFERDLSANESKSLFRVLAKTDLAALFNKSNQTEVLSLVQSPDEVNNQIEKLESEIKSSYNSSDRTEIVKASKQLAHFMITGEAGIMLRRNAVAISALASDTDKINQTKVDQIDRLVTLYALNETSEDTKQIAAQLIANESDGVSYMFSYLIGQRADEHRKLDAQNQTNLYLNNYKGYIPSNPKEGVSLVVGKDKFYKEMVAKGYTRIGDYNGLSTSVSNDSEGYYLAPISGKAVFTQGIIQNINPSVNGIHQSSGYSNILTAGSITSAPSEEYSFAKANKQAHKENKKGNEALIPVFDNKGNVKGFERTLDPKYLTFLEQNENLEEMLGVWRGRQIEEMLAVVVNEELVKKAHQMYENDIKTDPANAKQYLNIANKDELDTVIKDAVSTFPREVWDTAYSVFGAETFMVRKDMLEDVTGRREATVRDFWTGNTRWSTKVQNNISKFFMGLFGKDAYKLLTKSEQFTQGLVSSARSVIVVKSIIIPAYNVMSGIKQNVGRGVSPLAMFRSYPKTVIELEHYTKLQAKEISLEADVRAENNEIKKKRLEKRIQSNRDAQRRLAIWPLLNNGEFSTIEDVGMSSEELGLTSGNFAEILEQKVAQLPIGLRTIGRYGIVAKDTSLYKGLYKSVMYGDFLAKAALFDKLISQGKTEEEALGQISDEFVHYDRLVGRNRGYLENVGLLWFWNYKIRSIKAAMGMLRNNPVSSIIAMSLPLGSDIGIPITDNLVSQFADGTLDYSIGPSMIEQGFHLNPWVNLTN